jgi:anti-sigma B factor antagonist
MKLKTAIVEGVLIVTCDGPRLDASFAKSFFTAIQGMIKKGYLDIVIDLTTVDFVDSTGLGAIVRCLKEIDNRGQLVLCGISKTLRTLLEMTRLQDVFSIAADRTHAITLLLANKEKQKKEDEAAEEELLEPLVMEDSSTIEEVENDERRRHRRVLHSKILNDDIVVYWTNISSGKNSTGVVVDISPGGVLMVSPSSHAVGDELILQGSIGSSFKFKEKGIVRSSNNGKYGIEFMQPDPETISFLNQLIGAVGMEKGSVTHTHS